MQTRLGWGKLGPYSHFLGLNVNISKTAGDTSKITTCRPIMTNRKSHMRFPLAPRLMTLDDHELSEFRGISQVWEPTTAKRMKIDPYCRDKIVAH